MLNLWPFRKSNEPTADELFPKIESELRTKFDAQQAAGVGRQHLLHQIETESRALEQQPETAVTQATLRAYDLLYSEIRPQMMTNLSMGKHYEMAGEISQAIRYYEAAMADQVPTRFPYEHLRVIYWRSDPEAALTVCQMALSNPFLSDTDHAHFAKWIERLETAVVS